MDQAILLTQNIEDSFEAKKKTGTAFFDRTAACDTVWHRGLTCKLLRLLPNKHMVRMILELIRNRSFTLIIGDSKRSRLRRLRNGVPKISVLAPSFLTSIYIYIYINIYIYLTHIRSSLHNLQKVCLRR